MSDRILGIAGLLIAAFYAFSATLIPLSFMSDPVGPKAFPFIIAATLGLSSLVFVLKPDEEPEWPTLGRLAEIGFAAVVLVLYALALPKAGFVLATAVTAAFLSWRIGAHPLAAVIAGVCIAVGIYVFFHLVLGLSLARGPWGF
ncbi:tripartite tricarboxylate transporter TctB family protein [Consotaella aegiceratis]|uniref:tripartite tricarboxylate transporter TctB family protein n=1 Tax=Consotaella aegiceratis TaxID=3097961 RepID=UPI002F3FF58D